MSAPTDPAELDALLSALKSGQTLVAGTPLNEAMLAVSRDAIEISARLNTGPHSAEEVRALLAELTGTDVPASVTLFPPFNADFGKNLTFGERVFINAGCKFQDQGGIAIGDDCLIGHNVVMATLDHGLAPDRRSDLIPAPVVLEENVWVGSSVTIVSGVTIGANAVVAAGAVVTKDVAPNTVVAGVPARWVRDV